MTGIITHVHHFESPRHPGDRLTYGVILNDVGRKYVWTLNHLSVDSEDIKIGQTVKFSVTRGDYALNVTRVQMF